MKRFLQIILCLAATLVPSVAKAQGIPALPSDPAITRGTLPNGIEYFAVKSVSVPGHADFALVQKNFRNPEISRNALVSLPHLGNREPYRYFAEHGCGYSPEGYISYPESGTRFDFRGIDISGKAVADTTLMILFDIAATSPGEQAIIVCGDITPAEVTQKMRLFSLLVEPRGKIPDAEEEGWLPEGRFEVRFSENLTKDVAAIHLFCTSGRVPDSQLGTAMPMITRMLATEFGTILKSRLEAAFFAAGLPLAKVEFRYKDASGGPGNDIYNTIVYTSASELSAASKLVASVLSDLDKHGATLNEYRNVRSQMVFDARRRLGNASFSNPENVDRCAAAFHYGTNLAPAGTFQSFIAKRSIPEDRELNLFNNFAKALLDLDKNMYVRFDVPDTGISQETLETNFKNSWKSENAFPGIRWDLSYNDGRLLSPKGKIKIQSETTEPITGGKLMTFSNGMKVIYKNTPSAGEFRYGLLLRGGYPDILRLAPGEERYVGDLLSLYEVGGMSGRDFRKMLAVRGVTMNASVGMTDTRLFGWAPSYELELVLRSLLSIANDRKIDRKVFSIYRREAELREDMKALAPRDADAITDRMLFPRFPYNLEPDKGTPTEGLQSSAELFFAQQFLKMSDGVLVLVGDLGEESIRKILCSYLGGFSTQRRFSQRPIVERTAFSGGISKSDLSVTGTVGGAELGTNLELSVPMNFTIANYTAIRIAAELLKTRLCEVLAPNGYFLTFSERLELFPEDQVVVNMNIHPCRKDGLPAGVEPADVDKVLEDAGKLLRHCSEIRFTAAETAVCMSVIMDGYNRISSNPEALINTVMHRYSEGKDIISDYRNAVSSVGEASVRDALGYFENAASAIFTIR